MAVMPFIQSQSEPFTSNETATVQQNVDMSKFGLVPFNQLIHPSNYSEEHITQTSSTDNPSNEILTAGTQFAARLFCSEVQRNENVSTQINPSDIQIPFLSDDGTAPETDPIKQLSIFLSNGPVIIPPTRKNKMWTDGNKNSPNPIVNHPHGADLIISILNFGYLYSAIIDEENSNIKNNTQMTQ